MVPAYNDYIYMYIIYIYIVFDTLSIFPSGGSAGAMTQKEPAMFAFSLGAHCFWRHVASRPHPSKDMLRSSSERRAVLFSPHETQHEGIFHRIGLDMFGHCRTPSVWGMNTVENHGFPVTCSSFHPQSFRAALNRAASEVSGCFSVVSRQVEISLVGHGRPT